MNCNNLGIGLIVLSITLFMGITISEFFKLKDIPEIEVIEESILNSKIESLKNCASLDRDLKYQTLPYNEEKNHFIKIEENNELIIIPVPKETKEDKEIDNSKKEEKNKKEVVLDSPIPLTESPIPLPVEDLSEYKTLLHKEICREK